MNEKQQPLVSCIMPTYNRRAFVPQAIHYFLRQDYENKELIVIDDGTDNIKDLVPDIQTIRYFRLDQKTTLGAKLNIACSHARGKIIANWDDDDWYAARRLTYQVNTLQNEGTDLCGINNLLYYDLENKLAYRYIYPPDQPAWLLGSSLCYTKDLWNHNHFADINVGMDGLFVWATSSNQITVLPDSTIAVHMIHGSNISPKKTEGEWWHKYPVAEVKNLMQYDWSLYSNNGFIPVNKNIHIQGYPASITTVNQHGPLKNIYACLVHENEDTVIDLVRNLHFLDPDSIIFLYNGGENPGLVNNYFPFEKFGAIPYPEPVPVKHGYLHNFALNCMQFALENFSFDTITMIDSDQLAIRSGYSGYMGHFLSDKSNTGMLSSLPERITPEYKDDKVWPAVQAYKEYELWKPFLQKFTQGETKFVHWTFWPSTVFTSDAVKDLTKLFKENNLLQQILKQSKIWATEEVVLPTLVRLLGYEILLNPCSYEFVRYRKLFTLPELNNALDKANAYWIHPIERKYENPLRNQVRQRFNHYMGVKPMSSCKEHFSPDLFLRQSLINKIKNIEGWLDDKEAELLIAITLQSCKELELPHSIVEIGSYHGKSTVIFGSIVKAHFPGVKVCAIDPHDGKLGASDQGLHSFPPSYEMFKRNIENEGLSGVIEIIRNNSSAVKCQTPVSLLFIDGLHDYPNVARDFYHFSEWMSRGGYVAFHDYADYFPGVKAFVHELLETGTYREIYKVESLIVLKKL